MTKVAANKCNIWEIDAKSVTFQNPAWSNTFESFLIPVISDELDLDEDGKRISVKFRKLRLCQPGQIVQPLAGNDENSGVFATIVMCLPSVHQGGEIDLKFEGQTHTFDSAKTSEFNFCCVGWRSEATYESKPITSGNRLELVYDLVHTPEVSGDSSNLQFHNYTDELTRQLKLYNTRLEQKDPDLPPYQIFRLRHKYKKLTTTEKMLKGTDAAVLKSLASVAKDLDIDLYLANLDRKIYKERWEGPDFEREVSREESLSHLVGLNGSRPKVVITNLPENLVCDNIEEDDYLDMDSEPNQSWNNAYGMGHEAHDDDVTYTYVDKVIILVPPMGKADFYFMTHRNGSNVAAYFRQLKQEMLNDRDKELQLRRLCELVLKEIPAAQARFNKFDTGERPPKLTSALIDEAKSSSLELDRLDLGRIVAQNGVEDMKDKLDKKLEASSTLADKMSFFYSVEVAFKAYEPQPEGKEINNLEDWWDSALSETVSALPELDKDEAAILAEFSERIDWDRFEATMKPLVFELSTMARIVFINKLMSLSSDMSENQKTFITPLIRDTWDNFAYNGSLRTKNYNIKGYEAALSDELSSLLLNNADLSAMMEHTVQFLPNEDHSDLMIKSMTAAVPFAPSDAVAFTFIWFIRGFLADEFPRLEHDSDDTLPTHQAFVQALLVKYIQTFAGFEPQPLRDWRLPDFDCTCQDCNLVNTFLQDEKQDEFSIQVHSPRRNHLDKTFGRKKDAQFKIKIDKRESPYVWRLTKHQRGYEKHIEQWRAGVKTVKKFFPRLVRSNEKHTRLQNYLGRCWDAIMNVQVDQIPDLADLCEKRPLSEVDVNVRSKVETRNRRKRTKPDDSINDKPNKRRRNGNRSASMANSEKENEEVDVDVVDLTGT